MQIKKFQAYCQTKGLEKRTELFYVKGSRTLRYAGSHVDDGFFVIDENHNRKWIVM